MLSFKRNVIATSFVEYSQYIEVESRWIEVEVKGREPLIIEFFRK